VKELGKTTQQDTNWQH